MSEEYGLTPGEAFPIDELVFPVEIGLNVRGDSPQNSLSAEKLVKGFQARIQEGMSALVAFRMGRVYCFQCDQPDCVHSRPASSADTFSGYTPTGKPSWRSFPNLCMERGDQRVDKLYGDFPEVIALVQSAEELKGELLPGFGCGSLVYNVLGQVVAGLVPSDLGASREPPDRVALTLQLVETRSGLEKRRLRLNLLGLSLDEVGTAAGEGSYRSPATRLAETMRVVRQQLRSLGRQAAIAERAGRAVVLDREMAKLLVRLRGDLERIFKPHRSRTRHAKHRHQEGERPTSLALKDAGRASDERLLLDTRNDTVVVLGPKSRAHIFSADGRHVTSLQLDPGEVERKTARKRWRPLSQHKAAEFRASLAQNDSVSNGTNGEK